MGERTFGARTIPVGLNPVALAVDERRGRAYVVEQGARDADGNPRGPGDVRVVDLTSGRTLRVTAVGYAPSAAVVDARTGRVFVANAIGRDVSVLDARDGALLGTIRGIGPGARLMDDDGAGHVLVVAGGVTDATGLSLGGGSVTILDAGTMRIVGMVPGGVSPSAAVALPGRAFILDRVAAAAGSVDAVDIGRRRVIRSTDVTVSFDGLAASAPLGPARGEAGGATGRVFVLTQRVAPPPSVLSIDTITVLDADDGSARATVAFGSPDDTAVGLALDRRAGHLIVPVRDSANRPAVDVLDAGTGRLLRRIAVDARPSATPLGPGGVAAPIAPVLDERTGRALVATSSLDGLSSLLHIVDTRGGALPGAVPLARGASIVTMAADAGAARALVLATAPGSAHGTLTLIDGL